ncbi:MULTISPECIES: hypothetical protein [Myxococcus]|uniref:DUF4203 domain-containing protein n=1 Tax=Myxococcus xanthus TaxID=34 RepID=A0AAE6G4B6_MYXXA|nr:MULTISPECIES: hypothetical protein [Myxococcus]QDE70745.1 hypothetical protein BHS09_29325 [Myxococcus xanthus]QDE78024.1 hypothetical protein BHS08_29345 [Myxococcus xanthus]QDE85410.1 hypothetical protein BHS07_29930 [Myxococcus xanthus]QDE99567.1 hypothetical protein BHS05_29135 [Myxococcus xanthus]QDF07287.1 hypothetical protein BHS04_29445 [Myxococcus xanthus]
MEGLLQALGAYQTFNPTGWVAIYRMLPMWAGIVCCVAGVTLLVAGGGKLFRVLAGPIGAVLGLLWTPVLVMKLGLPDVTKMATIAAAVLMALGFLLPTAITFLGVGVPLGLLAGQIAGQQDFLLGFVPGFIIGGLVGAMLQRPVAVMVASAVGAWMLVIGALAALHQVGGVVQAVASKPWGVIIAAGLFAVAGAVYQLAVRPSPEEADKLRAERERLKVRQAEQHALEKRWGVK